MTSEACQRPGLGELSVYSTYIPDRFVSSASLAHSIYIVQAALQSLERFSAQRIPEPLLFALDL